jgi:hypothetical protein
MEQESIRSLARLGLVNVTSASKSGGSAILVLSAAAPHCVDVPRSTMALHLQSGLSMLAAKQLVEAVLDGGEARAELDHVPDVGHLMKRLAGNGIDCRHG